eukprot:scaffold19245_cov199-Amphora_coffeaeformis.AAC.15
MHGLSNAKRMELVQNLLKDEKKKKSVLKKKKSAREMSSRSNSSVSLGGSSHSIGISDHSRGTVSSRSFNVSTKGPLSLNYIITLQQSWDTIKRKIDSVEVGERIVMSMIQADPKTRQALEIESLRSERCQEIASTIMETLDCFIYMLGPDFDEEDVSENLDRLTNHGINLKVLADAVPTAMIDAVQDMADKDKNVWEQTMPAALLQTASSHTAGTRFATICYWQRRRGPLQLATPYYHSSGTGSTISHKEGCSCRGEGVAGKGRFTAKITDVISLVLSLAKRDAC